MIMDQVETLDKQTIKELIGVISVKNLKRPLIAITNDLYTPSLIPLRQISHIIHCRPLSVEGLFLRIKEICENERIFIPEAYMKQMIGENSCDIRSCVNALQLLGSGRLGKQLNISNEDLKLASCKELNRSIFDIWRMIFTDKKVKNIRKLVLSFGDMNLINSGIFENFLNVLNKSAS